MTTQAERQKKYSAWVVFLGICAIILLVTYPLATITDSDFGGADSLGSEVVAEIAPEFEAEWVTNWWAPPGGETESMLFAVQAAAGGIFIGYFFGFMKGRQKGREEAELFDVAL